MRRSLSLLLFVASLQAAVPAERPLRVAVFKGLGADPECLSDAVEALRLDAGIRPVVLTAADIQRGALDRCDALVLAGGGGGRQMGNMGALVQAKVKAFVAEKGRGAVGLCAGAYMLSDTPDYPCFRLGGLEAIDREHDARGHGLVRFSFTPHTLAVFPEFQGRTEAFMQYFEGPVFVPAKGGAFTPMAMMQSDVALQNDAPKGMTPGRTFLSWSEAGKGRVFLASGHPENTPGLRWMLPRMVRWSLKQAPRPYSPAVVRVGRTDREVLFDGARRKAEAEAFQALLSGTPEAKLAAIPALLEMRSWGAKERLEGGLRDADPRVRAATGEALVDLEHTAALKDLEAAATLEGDTAARPRLQASLKALKAMVHAR